MTLTDIETRPPEAPKSVDPASILVVIPTLNEARHIETCIRSLIADDADMLDVDITVADGGSTDETVSIVKSMISEFPKLKLLDNPKRLQSAAINLAAGVAEREADVQAAAEATA